MARQRKKLLIVDGYNVLRSGSRYARITLPDYTDDTFNVARERLVNDVIAYAGRSMEAIIIYDGAERVADHSEAETIGGVCVMFSKRGQSADNLIEKLAHDARERGVETLVVTSDATIQDTVFGGGVDRMSAEGFCQELSSRDEDVTDDRAPAIASKRTVADRISPEVAARLKRMVQDR